MMLVAAPAASALASARVRLIDARPGDGTVQLDVMVAGQQITAGDDARYGQVTPYANVPAGAAQLELSGAGKANGSRQLAEGVSYTVVAIAKGSDGFALKVLRDADAKAGKARLRVLHAAPELGSPDLRLGRRTIAEDVGFKTATPYLSVDPGAYSLGVARPGSKKAIFEDDVSLSAGSATTAVLAGSAGARERVIVATDDTVSPAGAPETGLGGLALADRDGGTPPWLLAALAGLLAGALGGGTQRVLLRRGRR